MKPGLIMELCEGSRAGVHSLAEEQVHFDASLDTVTDVEVLTEKFNLEFSLPVVLTFEALVSPVCVAKRTVRAWRHQVQHLVFGRMQ